MEGFLSIGYTNKVGIEVVIVVVQKKLSAQNISWVSDPVTCGIIPVLEEIIWSNEVISMGLVSKGFLIDPHDCLPLVLHDLLS